MCGIAGLIVRRGARRELAATVGAMTTALAHRGPDDAGLWLDAAAGVGLGHRRLAILDPGPSGHQPMLSESGRYVLSYNGEIYNFRELRPELAAAGARFRGAGDSEVLLAALERWGLEAALGRVAGMFAFALWDRAERRLHLVRDHLGIKPLYWSYDGQELAFASELGALLARSPFSPVIDRTALAAYARWNYVPAPYAILAGVRKLRPGHVLTLDAAGRIEERAFWRLADAARDAVPARRLSEPEALAGLRAVLSETVRQQMLADVPLGALLSGGIDSSVLTALMQAGTTRPVKTFTIGYDDPAFDEAPFARAVAERLGTEHHELHVGPADARAVIADLAQVYDEPFADSSQIPTVLVARFVRAEVKVCLAGDGGDELFAGYERYHWAARVGRAAAFLPGSVRRGLAAAIDGIPPQLWRRLLAPGAGADPGRIGDRTTKLARLLAAAGAAERYRSQLSHWPRPGRLVIGAREPDDLAWRGAWSEDLGSDPIARQQLADLASYVPDDLLTKLDRATMAVGLEARVPFLDHRVVEHVWRLPAAFRHRRGVTKYQLRRLLDEHLPRALVERPKRGFRVPLAVWLRGPLRAWAEDLLAEPRLRRDGLLEPAVVRRAWSEFQAGRGGLQEALWGVLMFQAWHAALRDRTARAPRPRRPEALAVAV